MEIPNIFGNKTSYTAEKNISLFNVARPNKVAIDHIMMANKINSLYINKGKEIIMPTFWIPPLANIEEGLVLNLPERSIYLYKNNEVVAVYPVAIGALGWNTPTGSYSLAVKQKNPTWFPPSWANVSHPVYPGPNNPLGDRWMGLSRNGYGIHGTNNPQSIGLAASHGCIRMYTENARELFEQVAVGMPIKIIYESIKVGFNPDTGKFYISVFPDIYSYGTNSLAQAKSKLAKLGLDKITDEKKILTALREKRGIPVELIGSDYKIQIGNEETKTHLAPIVKNNEILVEAQVLENLGFDITYDEENKELTIDRGFNRMTVKLNSDIAYFNGKGLKFNAATSKAGSSVVIPLTIVNYFGYNIEKDKDKPLLAITVNPAHNPIWAMESEAYKRFTAQNGTDTLLFKKNQEKENENINKKELDKILD
ncbi:MAG: L,D-transpeptidase family protein [Armatimonadota bacterium]